MVLLLLMVEGDGDLGIIDLLLGGLLASSLEQLVTSHWSSW